MRSSRPWTVAGIALIVGAGCTIEVNVNTHPDDEPSSPVVTAAPEVPGAEVSPRPPAPPVAARPPVPPPPMPPPAVEPDDDPVRDALFRFRRERVEPQRVGPRTTPDDADLAAQPTFTPFTKAPRIVNRAEVVAALEQEYPPLLRDAGIGGTVRVYFFIDEHGDVGRVLIDQSSGHAALDEAARRVAAVYRFSPALNRDAPVPVWVSFPITFRVP